MNAEEYKKLASAKRVEDAAIDVTLPSGCVWKLKEPPIQQWVIAGKLPSSLVAKMASAAQNASNNGTSDVAMKEFAEQLTPEDIMNNLAFGRDLLLHCAVEPRITPDGVGENAIRPEDILPDDFMFLINWVMRGGRSGESLDNFRA